MKIERAEISLVQLPLKFRFETSFGVQTQRTFILLKLQGEGITAYGEGVMENLPLYREETNAGAWDLLKNVFLPRVLGKEFAHPYAVMNDLAPFRGNRMTKAIVEMAAWDFYAKSLDVPLWQLIGGTQGEKIAVGVSLGIQPTPEATVELVQKHVEQGYKRIKLKIKPGWDLVPVKAVREAFPNLTLTVDANSAYTLADTRVFQELDQYRLDYIEQPLAFDDVIDHQVLQSRIQTPLCLDESITTAEDARKALSLGSGRVINLKPGRVGGIIESMRINTICQASGVPMWMGGMLEAGVGRAFNIHIATLPAFSKPGDVSSASRYWQEDIVHEALEARDGFMPVPAGKGIGVTVDENVVVRLRVKHEVL